MKEVVSVDWLSLYCSCGMLYQNIEYDFYEQEYHSAHFEKLYFIVDRKTGEKVAEVQRKPFSKILPADAAIIKFENKVLYREDWNWTACEVCRNLGLDIKSISRIDICADFNTFENGYHPRKFINDFLTNKIIKMGRTKFTLQGTTAQVGTYDYIRFGSRTNEICTYLYNKTKELREVHDKPWIREKWKQAGLDVTKDVWRLEFSMKTTQLRTVVKQNGYIVRLDLDYISSQNILENIYKSVAQKWFDFRINDGQKKKCRMKHITMLSEETTTLEHIIMCNKVGSNRTDKIVAKKLANCLSQYAIESDQDHDAFYYVLSKILDATDLWDYYKYTIAPNVGYYIIR